MTQDQLRILAERVMDECGDENALEFADEIVARLQSGPITNLNESNIVERLTSFLNAVNIAYPNATVADYDEIQRILDRFFPHGVTITHKDRQRAEDAVFKADSKYARISTGWKREYIKLALTQLGRITTIDKCISRGMAFSRHVPELAEVFNRKAAYLLTSDESRSKWPHGRTCAGRVIEDENLTRVAGGYIFG